jgi:hypothetical protein
MLNIDLASKILHLNAIVFTTQIIKHHQAPSSTINSPSIHQQFTNKPSKNINHPTNPSKKHPKNTTQDVHLHSTKAPQLSPLPSAPSAAPRR